MNNSKESNFTLLTIQNLLESLDCVFERHQFARGTREYLSDLEGLAQKSLDLTGAGNSQFVIFRQIIHTQDSNDVLKRFVILK